MKPMTKKMQRHMVCSCLVQMFRSYIDAALWNPFSETAIRRCCELEGAIQMAMWSEVINKEEYDRLCEAVRSILNLPNWQCWGAQ